MRSARCQIRVPPALKRDFEKYARRHHKNMSHLIVEFMTAFVANEKAAEKARGRPRSDEDLGVEQI